LITLLALKKFNNGLAATFLIVKYLHASTNCYSSACYALESIFPTHPVRKRSVTTPAQIDGSRGDVKDLDENY